MSMLSARERHISFVVTECDVVGCCARHFFASFFFVFIVKYAVIEFALNRLCVCISNRSQKTQNSGLLYVRDTQNKC